MNETEFQALVAKVGTETASKIKEATEPLQTKLNAMENELAKKGVSNITAEDIAKVKSEIETENKKLEGILEKQGLLITELKAQINSSEVEEQSIIKVFEAQSDAINKVQKNGTGVVEFRIGYKADKFGNMKLVAKAADVHNTTTTGANASITENVSDAAILRGGADTDAIETVQRDRPWILEFVSVGMTTASALTWFDEVPKQGDFAVTAEGAVKPLVMYTFNRTSSDYKKATGRAKITEEFNNDFARLVSMIKDLMKTDCRNEMNDLILADMVTNATAYSNAGLVGQIDNADNYAAIAAAAGQLGNSYYTPNLLVMNNNQGIVSASLKGTDGQYINPASVMNEINSAGLNIIKHPSVAFGKFFLGDASVYKVLLKGDLVVRIGYSNDDFDRNQYSLVVEQYFYSYISQARKAGLVYGDFAEIKAAIEKA
jgi:hypothetical protein